MVFSHTGASRRERKKLLPALGWAVGLFALCSVHPAAMAQERISIGVSEHAPLLDTNKQGDWVGPIANVVRKAAEAEGVVPEFVALAPGTVSAALAEGRVDAVIAPQGSLELEAIEQKSLRQSEQSAGGNQAPSMDSDAGSDINGPGGEANAREDQGLIQSIPLFTDTIGVASESAGSLIESIRKIASPTFLKIVLGLAMLLLFVGFLVWLAERRQNDKFSVDGHKVQGIGNSFWWAGVTMTTIGYGDYVPQTRIGRGIAMIWMLISMIITASLTAYIVSATGIESSGADLESLVKGKRVGLVQRDPPAALANIKDLTIRNFADEKAAQAAIESDEVDVLVGPAEMLNAQYPGLNVKRSNIQMRPLMLTTSPEHAGFVRSLDDAIETSHHWSEIAGKLSN